MVQLIIRVQRQRVLYQLLATGSRLGGASLYPSNSGDLYYREGSALCTGARANAKVVNIHRHTCSSAVLKDRNPRDQNIFWHIVYIIEDITIIAE